MLTRAISAEKRLALQHVFSKYPLVQAAYLFGSQATGSVHANSDFDFAIWPRSAEARQDKLEILSDLVQIGFDNVSLIFLDVPNYLLRHEAVRLNQIVYQTDDFDANAVYSLVVRQYLDFQPYLESQRSAYKERVAHG